MSFLSDIATALAIILVSCGVNLTEISGGEVSVPAAIATEAPATTESATPEPTAESETDPAQPAASPEATASADVQSAQSAVTASFVTEAEVESDVQTLATQMYAGIISGVKYQAPAIVEDNADTHLSTRWVDYMAASTARDDSTKPDSIFPPGCSTRVPLHVRRRRVYCSSVRLHRNAKERFQRDAGKQTYVHA